MISGGRLYQLRVAVIAPTSNAFGTKTSVTSAKGFIYIQRLLLNKDEKHPKMTA